MINNELNHKLQEANHIFSQYQSLINAKKSSIPDQFQADAEKAQIDFLMFSLDSVVRVILTHGKNDDNKEYIYQHIQQIRDILDKVDSSNPKLCVAKLEEASSIWSQLCH